MRLTPKEKLLLDDIWASLDYWKDHGDDTLTQSHLNIISKIIRGEK